MTVVIGLVVLVVSLGLYLSSVSLDWGLAVCETDSIHLGTKEGVDFSTYGERTYQYLAGRYIYSSFFVSLFLLGYAMQRWSCDSNQRNLGIGIGLTVPLILALHQLWWVIAEKLLRSKETYWNEPADSLMRYSLPFDWVCLVLIIVLIVIQALISVMPPSDSKEQMS